VKEKKYKIKRSGKVMAVTSDKTFADFMNYNNYNPFKLSLWERIKKFFGRK
jgi:hypothetical protein